MHALSSTAMNKRRTVMHTNIYYKIQEKIKKTGASWDLLAPNKENAIVFAYIHINPEPKKMIDIYHYSMEYCLAHSGETINERFRQDRPDKIDLQIADTVSKQKNNTPLVLYRGVCAHVFQLMKENASNLPDTDLYEKGFLQCSLVKGHEINAAIKLRIYVPTGYPVIYLGNVNDEQKFYEVDIQHGTKLKIVSIDRQYINCYVVF